MPLPCRHFNPASMHRPLRRVDHERNLGNLGLAPQQLQEARHRGDAVDHSLVHADVENVGAILHLLPRNTYRLFVLARP